MAKTPGIDKVMLKNSIRLVIGGFLFDDGDIEEIVPILREIANDYDALIKKILKTRD